MRVPAVVALACSLLATLSAVPASSRIDPSVPDSAVVVHRIPQGGIQPEAVVDAAGVLHLIYFAGPPAGGDLFYVRSTDSGATFSTPVRVNSQAGSAIATGTIRGGQLALGRGGRVHVVWNGSDTALPHGANNPDSGKPGAPFLYTRSTADGRGFEAQRRVSGGVYSADGGGSVAASPDGRVYAVWHGNRLQEGRGEDHRLLWIAESRDDGATFAAEKPAWSTSTGACGCCQARALASSDGGLTLLYRSATGLTHRDIYVLTSTDRGATFRGSVVQPWELNACPMTSLSLVAEGSRTLAAWETAGQVFFGSIDRRAARVEHVVAAPGQGLGRKHPRLAASADRTLMVWTEGTSWNRGGSVAWQLFDGADKAGPSGAAPSLPVWSFATAVTRPDGSFVVLY